MNLIDQRRRTALVAALAATAALFLGACGTPGGAGTDPTGTVAAATGTDAAGDPTEGPPPAESSTAVYGVRVDVLQPDKVLRTTQGRTYQLTGTISYVLRVPVGWLYGRTDVKSPVTLLRPDGSALTLEATMENVGGEMPGAPVVSADGSMIAWSTSGAVHTGRLTATGIVTGASSTVPGDTYPLLWLGNERLVLGKTYDNGCCGYRKADYDVWQPSAGAFVAHWTRDLSPVYGPVPAGRQLFAVKRTDTAGAGCLAQLNGVTDLSTTATACVAGMHYGSLRALYSPDGAHLLEGIADGLVMFDLATVMTTKAKQRDCAGDTPLVWEDSNTALTANAATRVVTRCSTDGSAPSTVAGLTLGPAMPMLVARRG